MVLALIVLVGFGLLFMFAFDEGFQGGAMTIESEISTQAKDIDSYVARIAEGTRRLEVAPGRVVVAKELGRAKRESVSLTEQIASLKTGVEAGKAAILAKGAEWETYKDRYREYIRQKSKGEDLAKLETRDGSVYSNVNIREVTAIGIQIRHDNGFTRIAFEDLSDEMQDHYQFDPSQKEAAVAAEADARALHEAAAAVANSEADQQMAAQRAKDDAEAKEKIQRSILEKQEQIASATREIGNYEREIERANADADAARAAGKMHLNKSGNIRSKIRFQTNRIATLRAEIGQLQSRL